MKKVKITVMRKACYPDLMEQYENPIEHACDVQEGQVFIANGWQKPDYYFVLQELLPYIDRKLDALTDYQDIRTFTRKCIVNTASAGKFSSDRTIRQYADEIWHIKEVPHHDGIKLW